MDAEIKDLLGNVSTHTIKDKESEVLLVILPASTPQVIAKEFSDRLRSNLDSHCIVSIGGVSSVSVTHIDKLIEYLQSLKNRDVKNERY